MSDHKLRTATLRENKGNGPTYPLDRMKRVLAQPVIKRKPEERK